MPPVQSTHPSGPSPWAIWALICLSATVLLALVVLSIPGPARFDRLKINGNPSFQEQVVKALSLLRSRSPNAYQIVTNNIGAIVQAKHSGMAAYRNPPTFDLNDRTAFYSVTWCAGSIAHDSMHSKLYFDYRRQHAGAPVPDHVWIGAMVEKTCTDYQRLVLEQVGAPSNEVAHCVWNPKDRYWEIDYQKRNW
jgi:hypothetical protein